MQTPVASIFKTILVPLKQSHNFEGLCVWQEILLYVNKTYLLWTHR